MKFSLIIPAFNEAQVIVPTVRDLCQVFSRRFEEDWNILVVDNGSDDGTHRAVLSMNDKRVGVLSLGEKGKGHAVRAGMLAADGDLIGFTDADLSVEPDEIADAFLSVRSGEADVVCGSRVHEKSKLPGREWWRTASSRIFNMLERTIVGVHVFDTQCPLKVMDHKGKEQMLATKERGWFFDMEFLLLCEQHDVRIKMVPVTWNEHRYPERRSKLSMVKDGFRAILAMLRIRVRHMLPLTLGEKDVTYAPAGVIAEEGADAPEAPPSDIVLK